MLTYGINEPIVGGKGKVLIREGAKQIVGGDILDSGLVQLLMGKQHHLLRQVTSLPNY